MKRPDGFKKNLKLNKKRIAGLLSVVIVIAAAWDPVLVSAVTDEEIEEQSELIDELEQQQEELEDEIDSIEEESSELEDEIDSLNSDIAGISETIEEIAQQIEEKESEIADKESEIADKEDEILEIEESIEETKESIEETQELIDEASSAASEQYESLKMWIRYTYIYDTDSIVVSLLSSGSFAEFLNRLEYLQSIYEYGNELIEGYKATAAALKEQQEMLKEQQAALEEQEESLTAGKAALEEEQASLESGLEELDELENEASEQKSLLSDAIEESQDSLASAQSQLSDAEAAAAALEEEIEAQKAYEKQLEQQQAEEEAARIEEILEEEENNTAAAVVSTDESDLTLLAALIYCEAGGEIYEGQLAVGCVVMNRVRSSAFPNTVSGVIYQSNQFSPVASGRLATVLANDLTTDSCYQAAAYVLAGNLPYPDFLYFRAGYVTLTGVDVTWIGNQQFF